ncbi:MAG: dihydroorotate dehydrogenase [Candidatus Nezhaarchaeota archaeon]|nr:dihydroorotate dehydrogenase [Candidatus Nezhaarchaeota archaeon]
MSLETSVASLSLRNPFMNASGVFSSTASLLKRVVEAGAGAVVTKSLSIEPREGYPNPVLVELPFGYVNAIGLANPGLDAFAKELSELGGLGVPVIFSVFGSSVEEFAEASFRAEELGASAIELNFSCPHAGGLLTYSQDPKLAYDLVSRVRGSVSVPIFPKLSAEAAVLIDVAKSVERAGADGVTAINSLRALCIDIDLRRPRLSSVFGGLSGPAIKPVAVRCVYELYEELSVPIIGVGGVSSHEDAIELLLAGASAIQVGSALAKHGLSLFRELVDGARGYLERHGFSSIKDLVGLAHGR